MKKSMSKLYERTVMPLQQKGYLEVIHPGKGIDSFVNAMFHEAGHHKNRLGLSQSGRILVQRIYRKLEGGEPIKLS